MKLQQQIEKTAEFVNKNQQKMAAKNNFSPAVARYRFPHTLRMTNLGRQLAEAEDANMQHVILGCLLHDVSWFDDPDDPRGHGRLGAQLSRPFLTELGLPSGDVDAICYAVAVHVDGQAGFEHPATLESEIVSDADNIDRFDALGMLNFCKDELDDLDALAEKLAPRIKTLEDYRERQILGTPTGNKLFNVKLERQLEVFKALVAQKENGVLPEFD